MNCIISVIIPTFNCEHTIKRCIDSILKQTYPYFEIIIMDNLSSDLTTRVIKDNYVDERVRLYSEPDKGIYDAMNKAIKKANGDWLIFLGADDYLFTCDVFEKFSKYTLIDFDFVYGEVDTEDKSYTQHGVWNIENIESNPCHQSIFYRRTVFNVVGLYDVKYKICADSDLNMKCFFSKRVKLGYIPIVISHFSTGGSSYTYRDQRYEDDYFWLLIIRSINTTDKKFKIFYLQKASNYFKYRKLMLKYYIVRLIKFILLHT